MRLRNRLALVSTALAAVVLALALTTVYVYTRRVELRRVDADAREQLRDLTDARGNADAYVAAHRGRLLAVVDRGRTAVSDARVRPLLAQLRSNGALRDGGRVTVGPEEARFRAAVASRGAAREVVFVSLEPARDTLRRLLLAMFAVGGAGILAAAVVAWIAARRWLSPLDAIAATADRVRLQALAHRTGVGGGGELGALGAALDEMLARLETGVVEQRRFLQDVSHELRTPLTVARGRLEILAANPGADPDEVGTEIALALDELDRIASLVDGLLELARAGALQKLAPEPVDVAALLAEVATQFEAIADRRFTVAAPDGVTVHADRRALRQVLDNLVRNAIEASDEGSTIELSLRREDGGAVVAVRDHGHGIDPALRPRLFERFAHGSPEGIGLGLAISRALVEAHGGWITGEDAPGGGACFSIRLPADERSLTRV